MFFDNNDFDDSNFGYSTPENSGFGFNGYPFGETHGESSTTVAQTSRFDLDTTVAGPSTAEIEAWWLEPKSDGGVGQYAESTLLDLPQSGFTGPYDSQNWNISGTNGLDMNNVHGFNERYANIPEHPGLFTAGPSTTPFPHPPSPPPATFTGPITTTPPVPMLSWGHFPPPTTSYMATANNWPGVYGQPFADPGFGGQWPYPTSVGKGKPRATGPLPLVPPSTTGNAMWQYQQPRVPQYYDVGSNLQRGTGVPNTDISTQVAASTGPQRPVRCAKGTGKATDKSGGKRKRPPKMALPPGVNWDNTSRWFCAEMGKIYHNQPTGEVIKPEVAYARSNEIIKEDLHFSPLMVKSLGERPSRDLEQYLTGVLNELRPRGSGQKRGVRYMLERVAEELNNKLVIVNDDFTLLDGPSNEIDPEELDNSEQAAKRRIAEKARRDVIRGSLERMTLFFKVPEPGILWSRPQVLFFAITYLVFGARAFGYGSDFFTPKPRAQAAGSSYP